MNQTADETIETAPENAAFAFVQELAAGLSRKEIELPSFPDVAIRVRRVLADEDVSAKDVVRVVGSEPALAARIMQMANSAALGHVGKPIADLRAAITRIGFNLVRSAAISFAMGQVRRAENLKSLGGSLQAHWEHSSLVAAFSHVVARRLTRINPDTALLAGLLHGVGKLYILTQAVRHPALFNDQAAYFEVERDWHVSIAKALLETWQIPEDIVAAVESHEDTTREHEGAPDLTDVLTVGSLLATFHAFPDTLELNLQGVSACERMRLDRKALEELVSESEKDVASLRQMLGL
ncbi:MAG: HDOD domain-containing protein [Gammaproteobacteria bacterium]|jgi:HD-like signal output (HDOD) protein|nr:HDOD domain-containing protein [Gammaproteobacteria bacterium]